MPDSLYVSKSIALGKDRTYALAPPNQLHTACQSLLARSCRNAVTYVDPSWVGTVMVSSNFEVVIAVTAAFPPRPPPLE